MATEKKQVVADLLKLRIEELEYLQGLVKADIERDAPVVPVEPPAVIPDPPPIVPPTVTLAVLRVMTVVEATPTDVLIQFGFEKNRVARLQYKPDIGSNLISTTPDLTGKFGSVGLEHKQWLRKLPLGTGRIYAQTFSDGVAEWVNVGKPLTVAVDRVWPMKVIPDLVEPKEGEQVALGIWRAGVDPFGVVIK